MAGAVKRQARERLLEAARRREIDVVLVWRLDRWGRSRYESACDIARTRIPWRRFRFADQTLDPTTPAGYAIVGLLAIFAEFKREILRERTSAGLAHAWAKGKRLGRPMTAGLKAAEVQKRHRADITKAR